LKDNIVTLDDIIAIIRHSVKIKIMKAPLDNIDHLGIDMLEVLVN